MDVNSGCLFAYRLSIAYGAFDRVIQPVLLVRIHGKQRKRRRQSVCSSFCQAINIPGYVDDGRRLITMSCEHLQSVSINRGTSTDA